MENEQQVLNMNEHCELLNYLSNFESVMTTEDPITIPTSEDVQITNENYDFTNYLAESEIQTKDSRIVPTGKKRKCDVDVESSRLLKRVDKLRVARKFMSTKIKETEDELASLRKQVSLLQNQVEEIMSFKIKYKKDFTMRQLKIIKDILGDIQDMNKIE